MERAGNKSHCPCRACPCLQIQPNSINFALLSWLATNSARSPLGCWERSAFPSELFAVVCAVAQLPLPQTLPAPSFVGHLRQD